MSLKIAMATEWFLPTPGGVAVHTYELSKKLLGMGNEVHIITSRTERVSTTDKKYELDGITVHRLCGFKATRLGLLFNVFTPFKLKELFKQEKFDVVHGQHIFTPIPLTATTVGKVMHPRVDCVVATSHSTCSAGLERFVLKLWKQPLHRTLGNVDRLIAITKAVAEVAVKVVDKSKIVVIPNGVDTDKFSPTNKGILDVDGPVVMSIGRLVQVKGLDVLIKSVPEITKEFPKTTLAIIGEGKMKKKLIELAKKLGIEKHIRLLGERKPHEIPSLLASCDIFVLPSLKEAQGRVLLEAMASGKPTIGTRVGGILDTIKDGENGILVEPNDPMGLANAIKRLLGDEKLCKRLGENARRIAVEKYSWNKVAKQTYELYQQVLRENR